MNFLSHALHGSTSFVSILIGQIVVVASLALVTLWLLVRRARFGPPPEMAMGMPQFVTFSGASPSAPAGQALDEKSGGYLEMEAKCAALQAENSQLIGMRNEYNGLQEKVKFLESKLLEYEILQEEIGTLSMLKIENEKLKKEISQLQAEINRRVKGKAAPVEEETEEEKVEPSGFSNESSASDATPEPALEVSSHSAPEPVTMAAPESTASMVPSDTASTAPASPPDGGLDGLLGEIEALTADLSKDDQKNG